MPEHSKIIDWAMFSGLMQTYHEIKPGLLGSSAVALGFFDGVHPGHQAVIGAAVAEARRLGIPAAVATFRDHPRLVISGAAPKLLTVFEQRLELFEQLGVDATLAISFSPDISHLSPQEYVRNVLIGALGAKAVSIGYNHHFGRNREGTPELLRSLGQENGFSVFVAPEVFVDGIEVSSSRIREALNRGDVSVAAKLLSRRYAVVGDVVRGQGRGKGIGFPTANLRVSEQQLLPARGVYAGVVRTAAGERLPSVVNIGFRPTVANDQIMTTEVHILDFDADIYGQQLELEFWQYLRSETKFDGIEALKNQIGADIRTARNVLPSSTSMTGFESKLPA
jgi:riboflavin kinase/FMN adenylyltransferase